jgi:Cdc6-like AAA superfamily ATPase
LEKRFFKKMEKETIENLKEILLEKIIEKDTHLPYRLTDQYLKIIEIISDSIENKQYNSAFLIGPNSSGKTLTINLSLSNFKKKEIKKIYFSGKWNLDDLTSIKYLKSEVSLINQDLEEEEDDDDDDDKKQDKLEKEFEFLNNCIKKSNQNGYVLIFVLDNFELMVERCPKTIYHILDSSHDSVSMVVFCVTTSFVTNISLTIVHHEQLG